MTNGNKRKAEQLGMSHGKAANRLRKMVMFDLLVETGRNVCFRCGKPVLQIDNLSIEHKEPWLDTDDPLALFFSLDNIAFSHSRCNSRARRAPVSLRVVSKSSGYKGVRRLPDYRGAKPWKAEHSVDCKSKHIGYFATAEEAARAYDEVVIKRIGAHAVTNASMGLLPATP